MDDHRDFQHEESGGQRAATPRAHLHPFPITPVAAVLVLLDISAIGFYALWFSADTLAVNRAEEHGFDQQQLLPHDTLFWLAAHAMMASLVILNTLLLSWWLRDRRERRQQGQPRPADCAKWAGDDER